LLNVRDTVVLVELPMSAGAPAAPPNFTLCVTPSKVHVTCPLSAMVTSAGTNWFVVVAVTVAATGGPPPPVATVSWTSSSALPDVAVIVDVPFATAVAVVTAPAAGETVTAPVALETHATGAPGMMVLF
jgi:hypothetical protein